MSHSENFDSVFLVDSEISKDFDELINALGLNLTIDDLFKHTLKNATNVDFLLNLGFISYFEAYEAQKFLTKKNSKIKKYGNKWLI